ncbi:MAG TPA: H-X9-DG-CTERM domain-containing protein [Tepidisphaeraceae bacterium]|jgi:prepilin-type processing-associated H-X9-DG protein
MAEERAEVPKGVVPLEYGRPEPRKKSSLVLLIGLISVVGMLLIFGILNANKPRVYYTPNWAKCGSNLRQIGQAMMLYANEHHGKYPDMIEELLDEDFGAEILVCPSTNDTKAIGATTQAIAANVATPGHLSYIYLGKGFTSQCLPNTVLCYEPVTNHGDGSNVLFGDGHVEFMSAAQMKKIIADLNAGRNPPGSVKGL